MHTRLLLILFLSCAALCACSQKDKKKELPVLPPGYDMQRAEKIKLKEELKEISGIYFLKDSGQIIAEDDEEGKLFKVDAATGDIRSVFQFHDHGDFEDLAWDGTYWYVLKSNGNLFRVSGAFTDTSRTEVFKPRLPGNNNFEGLFYNLADRKIYQFCKLCEGDSGKISVYGFNTVNMSFEPGPVMTIIPDRTMLQGIDSAEVIRPSAAAIHPVTGEWYILASVNHILIVAAPDGKWKKVYPLDKSWFKQPEGICFTPKGDLYISNEGRNGTANIVSIPWTGK